MWIMIAGPCRSSSTGPCLRIGGPSKGADEEVVRFHAVGRPVYHVLEDVPAAAAR